MRYSFTIYWMTKSNSNATINVGVMLFVMAFIAPVLVITLLLVKKGPETQFEVPGTTEVSVSKPGRYYLWNNFRTVYKGRSYNRPQNIPDGLQIRIHDTNAGELPFISDPHISETIGNASKNSIGYVEVERPGRLTIEVQGNGENRIFSFSRSFSSQIVIVALSVAAAEGLICWVLVKAARARKTASHSPITLGGLTGS